MTTFEQIIEKNMRAQIAGIEVLPICMYGPVGVGKSQTITAIANNMEAGIVVQSITSTSFESWSGIPDFDKSNSFDKYNINGRTNCSATQWTIPEVIASVNLIAENVGSAVLHLEDLHECDAGTEKIMYQLLLDKRIGEFRLHEKVAVIASMNNTKEANFRGFSAAVKSRLNLTEYHFNFDVWFQGFGRFLHPIISSFLKTHQQYISEKESRDLSASASARTWSKLSEEFNLYTNDELKDVYIQILSGAISDNAVASFDKHFIIYNKLNFRDMINKRSIPDISSINELSQVLYGMLFHEVTSAAEGVYIIDLLNDVQAQSNADTIIGFLSAEIATKYQAQLDGKEIAEGQQLVIDALLGTVDTTKYTLTKKQVTQLSNEPFNKRTELLTVVSTYLNH